MQEATERNEGGAPYQIDDWLLFPYKYFSWMLGGPTRSVLDLACGNNPQLSILQQNWHDVRSGDFETKGPNVEKMDILKIPEDRLYDTIFSFETIEHVPYIHHHGIMESFLNLSRRNVVIGTVNLTGQTYLDQFDIWKGENNPFHVAEYNKDTWEIFLSSFGAKFFTSFYNGGGQWEMRPGLSNDGVSVYALIQK